MARAKTKDSRIAQAREKKGLTRAQAAKKLRMSEGYLRQIELHGNCPFMRAQRIARFYGCPIAYLI